MVRKELGSGQEVREIFYSTLQIPLSALKSTDGGEERVAGLTREPHLTLEFTILVFTYCSKIPSRGYFLFLLCAPMVLGIA